MTYGYERWAEGNQPKLQQELNESKLLKGGVIKFMDTCTSNKNAIKVLFTKDNSFVHYYIDAYPACCAMYQLNYFGYDGVSRKEVKELFNVSLRFLRNHLSSRCRRVVLNTVEKQPIDNKDRCEFNYPDPVPITRKTHLGMMDYPFVHEWALSKVHQELQFVNPNTGNIIHFLEVAVDYDIVGETK